MDPVIGGYLSEKAGWRWVQAFLAIFTGLVWLVETVCIPETYAPLLLRKRGERLSSIADQVYHSKLEIERGKVSFRGTFGTALSRPWVLLFTEPIVFLLFVYTAIVHGALYMLFEAFPIVFQKVRGWSEGIGSLPFLAAMTGMMIAVVINMHDNKLYVSIYKQNHGIPPPEARLPPTMFGALAIPLGLFWFAWTNGPSIPWIVCSLATMPFGFGMVLVQLNVMNYLVDAFTIYSASVLAASSIIQSCFGAGFPLFTTYMYKNLGIHWASSVPAFLALACVPFLFVPYRYGPAIRRGYTYAADADDYVRALAQKSYKHDVILVKL